MSAIGLYSKPQVLLMRLRLAFVKFLVISFPLLHAEAKGPREEDLLVLLDLLVTQVQSNVSSCGIQAPATGELRGTLVTLSGLTQDRLPASKGLNPESCLLRGTELLFERILAHPAARTTLMKAQRISAEDWETLHKLHNRYFKGADRS